MSTNLEIMADEDPITQSNEVKSKLTELSENGVLATKMESIKETQDLIASCLETLREMLKNEKSLHSRTDGFFLLCFLRARKFDCDQAFVLLKNYYRLRKRYPEVYEICRPSQCLNAIRTNVHIPLRHRDQFGRALFIMNLGNVEPNICSLKYYFRLVEFIFLLIMKDEEVQKHGLVSIINFKNFGFRQLKTIRFSHAKHTASFVQDSFPLLFKEFHVVHEQSYISIIYTIIRTLFSEEFKQKIFFHESNMASLHKHIDPKFLPEELGGTLSNSECSLFDEEAFVPYDDDFAEDAKYGFK